ncbi:MAG: putative 5'-3' exonuclease 20 [Satyrvirus sp.]|uniref:Putative 5'-3' exonuclease 20 n=1 Tax=Satyrvirus sp. TaxID=2487771 RepID=A0A3G5AE15_9VIRU|nr:MAG: putative 5'-3' exonuclease 20 [Satyrvirus sp.]
MGVLRLMTTLLKHPATKDAVIENIPVIDCLLVDYNANIHYVLQKTITELNEILYYSYKKENNVLNMVAARMVDNNVGEYNFEHGLPIDDIKNRMEEYDDDYKIGTTYKEIRENLSKEDKIVEILFHETILYTRFLICSLNKGWIKKVYLSLDGTPSMAKLKEQRNRRYIGSHINNIKENIVKKFRFKNTNIYQINLFYYRSMICAGTKFMDSIQQALFNLNIGLDVDVSTINIKGEGEKKIIYAIDELNKTDNYSNYCIMSPDSDMLIMIGFLSNNDKFKNKKLYNFRIDYQKNNQYQFFDLKQLISNLQNYYSKYLNMDITTNSVFIDIFFMLVVFGNDFLPKLEPLNVSQHFDFVSETCLKLSSSGLQFIIDNKLNYKYLLEFFKLINKDIIKMSIEKSFNDRYTNFFKLCKQMSITDLNNSYKHPSIKPFTVNYLNFNACLRTLNIAFTKLINYLKRVHIKQEEVVDLLTDIHKNADDSYLMLVLPRLLRFPGSEYINSDSTTFFRKFIEYVNEFGFENIKFRTKLMFKTFVQKSKEGKNSFSDYLGEIEKMEKSMEPYRSMFNMADIQLMSFDLKNGELVDMRGKYYDMYVKKNITKAEIDNMVLQYITGIEWLYQYYISGQHHEWSGWYYEFTQPPLIDDIIAYLEKNQDCQTKINSFLSSCPENDMSLMEHYLYVTPNEYTNAGVSPNLSDVVHLIDGFGAPYLNKCQIKWHEYKKSGSK